MYAREYIRLEIATAADPEIVIAVLDSFGVSGFEQQGDLLLAYLPAEQWSAQLLSDIEDALSQFQSTVRSEVVPWANWNAQWEKSFHPIKIDSDIRVRASFHPPDPAFSFEIVIDPKMAFGTGHHATTAMMLRAMDDMHLGHKDVLDYGCGSGILSIFASMKGASNVLAIDYDSHSVSNTRDNLKANGIHNCEARLGSIRDVDGHWDIILANIHKEIILADAGEMYRRLRPGGYLLLSGVLSGDADEVIQVYTEKGLQHKTTDREEGWACLAFERQTDASSL